MFNTVILLGVTASAFRKKVWHTPLIVGDVAAISSDCYFGPSENVAKSAHIFKLTKDEKVKRVSNFRFLPLTEMSIGGISYGSTGKLIGPAYT